METTRTRSPYFSPNMAMAPVRRASSAFITSAWTSRSSISTWLIVSSTSASTDAGTAPAQEKSKRNRPGEFSEPACAAVGPSASRSAW